MVLKAAGKSPDHKLIVTLFRRVTKFWISFEYLGYFFANDLKDDVYFERE